MFAVVLIEDARQFRLFVRDAPEAFARRTHFIRGCLALVARLPQLLANVFEFRHGALLLRQHLARVDRHQDRRLEQNVGQLGRAHVATPGDFLVVVVLHFFLRIFAAREGKRERGGRGRDLDVAAGRRRLHLRPGEIVPDLKLGRLLVVEPEARFARAFFDNEKPAGIVRRILARAALALSRP